MHAELTSGRLHRCVRFSGGRAQDLGHFGGEVAFRHPVQALADESHGLAQFRHAYEIASVAVALLGHGYREVHVVVGGVGNVSADVETDAAGAQIRPAQTKGERLVPSMNPTWRMRPWKISLPPKRLSCSSR